MAYIYQIKNTENGKIYIGQTVDKTHRKASHFYELRNNTHKNKEMQKDYNNNPDAFVFEVVCECRETDLADLELFFINKYKTSDQKHGYNIYFGNAVGGVPEETRAKMSKAKQGNKAMQGKKLSEEWKQKIKDSQPHKRKVLCIETGITYESFAEAARQTGLDRSRIVSCCTGKRKATGGYHFKYAD